MLQDIRRPDGPLIVVNRCTGLCSVCTMNFSYSKYGINVFNSHTTANVPVPKPNIFAQHCWVIVTRKQSVLIFVSMVLEEGICYAVCTCVSWNWHSAVSWIGKVVMVRANSGTWINGCMSSRKPFCLSFSFVKLSGDNFFNNLLSCTAWLIMPPMNLLYKIKGPGNDRS